MLFTTLEALHVLVNAVFTCMVVNVALVAINDHRHIVTIAVPFLC